MNDDRLYLTHILERVERIKSYTHGGEAAFLADTMAKDAVVCNFEVIGEASKRISQRVKDLSPHIAWREMASFRDVLIHHYEGVLAERVWEAVAEDLPKLETQIKALLMIVDAEIDRNADG